VSAEVAADSGVDPNVAAVAAAPATAVPAVEIDDVDIDDSDASRPLGSVSASVKRKPAPGGPPRRKG
jgi:hypothetical protein